MNARLNAWMESAVRWLILHKVAIRHTVSLYSLAMYWEAAWHEAMGIDDDGLWWTIKLRWWGGLYCGGWELVERDEKRVRKMPEVGKF